VTLAIENRYAQIPDDSSASINTAGLLGANYIAVGAGSSDKYLHAGSEINFTQGALVLESIINKFFANSASGGSGGGGSGGSSGGGGSGASAGSGNSGASGSGANGPERPETAPKGH
jgi:phospholipid/cholesterol/gamma-HCH transport system substrate-binding protein